jgi:hypothetical protein
VYANSGTGDPIDYDVAISSTANLFFVTTPLAVPGVWRFGVRAYSLVTELEEQNLDAAVTIVLNAGGVDISQQPKAPTSLRAHATAGGAIRVEWSYNTLNPIPVPTGFHVYLGTGTPDYTSPAATVSFTSSVGGSYYVDLPDQTDGVTYAIGVRAYNAAAEEPNTNTVLVTADATGPGAVTSLTSVAVI